MQMRPAEIARAAEDPEKYNLIMNVISERLQMRDENWRLCYKALLLLEFLVKHGPLVGSQQCMRQGPGQRVDCSTRHPNCMHMAACMHRVLAPALP